MEESERLLESWDEGRLELDLAAAREHISVLQGICRTLRVDSAKANTSSAEAWAEARRELRLRRQAELYAENAQRRAAIGDAVVAVLAVLLILSMVLF